MCNLGDEPCEVIEGDTVDWFCSLKREGVVYNIQQGTQGCQPMILPGRDKRQTEWDMVLPLTNLLIGLESKNKGREANNVKPVKKPITDQDINLDGSYLSKQQTEVIQNMIKKNSVTGSI